MENEKVNVINENGIQEQFEIENIKKWDKIRYFAFKNRKKYPNLFFYYFNQDGILDNQFSSADKKKIFSIVSKTPKLFNGLWGYFSLIFNQKNGLEIYKFFSKMQIFSTSNSIPCFQDGKPYDDQIKVNLKKNIKRIIFKPFSNL